MLLLEDQPVIMCSAWPGLPGAILVGWAMGWVSCLREDFRTGKAVLGCMASVSDPLFLWWFRPAGERSPCSCESMRLAMCVSAMGDLGDATRSAFGFSGSFQLFRLGNGGSSLFRFSPLDSDLLGCAGSFDCPFELPGLLLFLMLFPRRRPQLRHPELEPCRERLWSSSGTGERRDSLDCARLRARLREPGKTYSLTLSLMLAARLGGRTDVDVRPWRSVVSCCCFFSNSARIHSAACASAAKAGSSNW